VDPDSDPDPCLALTNESGFGYGRGSGSFYIHHQDANKKPYFKQKKLFYILLFEGTFTLFSKIKAKKKSQNIRNQGFPTIFAL
jgi:hypothetical protein